MICRKAGAKTIGMLALIGCLAIAGVTMFLSCTSTVPTGHTGILTTFGRVEDVALANGLNFHKPWQNVVTMTNKEQNFTEANVSFSKDLQEVTYTYTVKYNLLPNAAPNIYKTVGENYFNILIKPQVNNAVKVSFGKREAEEMTENRSIIQAEINEAVSEYATSYGIEAKVFLDDFDFTNAYTNAIEAKQVAEQEALRDKTQQQMETERAKQLAERTKIQAENDAAIRKINADADAEAARVKAQADFEVAQLEADAVAYAGQKQAEATAALAAAITEEVVAYEYAQNWSGDLPQYMMDANGALPIIDIPMGEE
jgi:regulator of protease activity HflC (stomatin/prohibitin superfamily)